MTLPLLVDDPVILKGHSGYIQSVAFSPSTDQFLASGSGDKTIRLWNAESGADIATINCEPSPVYCILFSPDGTMIASGSTDSTIKLWDVGSRAQIATLQGHSNEVWSISFSPDGSRLVSGSRDKTIRIWDIPSKTSINTLKGHTDGVNSIVFSPDGKRIASCGSYDASILMWDVTTGVTTATLKGHRRLVASLTFSPSGEYLASGSYDNAIRLWTGKTGAPIATMEGHSSTVGSITFSPNSKYLASASWDNTIRVWDVASRSHIFTLEGHSRFVHSVAFSPDGIRLASGSDDRTVRIWNVPWDEVNVQPLAGFTSDLVGWTQDGQQDSTSLASISVPHHIDISGSVSLQDGTPVGSGGFGDLFLGAHAERGKVALKKPRRAFDATLFRRFLREVDLWCSISHPHVLPCLGMCKIGFDVYVVSPFVQNGDLLSCMVRGMDLNRSKLLFEVAEALTHLHHNGIVHGDVKAQNVLLADNGSALLCDFGLAKAFDTMATSTEAKGAGSVRWMAPELFLGESRSMASDVYSLGITIAEVLSGRAPYEHMAESLAVMFHVVNFDGRPPKEPSHSPKGQSYATLWEAAEKCWVKDVKARPYMAQVLGMLFPLTREKH